LEALNTINSDLSWELKEIEKVLFLIIENRLVLTFHHTRKNLLIEDLILNKLHQREIFTSKGLCNRIIRNMKINQEVEITNRVNLTIINQLIYRILSIMRAKINRIHNNTTVSSLNLQ
jgi:hypothetical protein